MGSIAHFLTIFLSYTNRVEKEKWISSAALNNWKNS